MLSVAVHKDLDEYQPKIIGKMTARTLISIAGALGVSVITGFYMWGVLGLDVSNYMYVIYAVSVPFWLCGFFKPKGMVFEKFVPLWFEFNFSDLRVKYTPTMYKIGLSETPCAGKKKEKKGGVYAKQYRELLKCNGIESYSPRAGRVVCG